MKVSISYKSAMDTLGTRLKIARTAQGLTQQAVAEHFRINRVSVSQWESDTTAPDIEKVPDLAKLLGTTTEWLLRGQGIAPETGNAPRTRSRGMKPVVIAGQDLVSNERRLPIYAAARGGEGHHIVTFDPIDHMKMPAVLDGVKGGYGLLLTGDSMVPAYRPGDVALVNPNLPPIRDTDVVLYHSPQLTGGEEEAIIKRLVGLNDHEWTLEQYNPAEIFKEHRADWQTCHRVVGKYNSR